VLLLVATGPRIAFAGVADSTAYSLTAGETQVHTLAIANNIHVASFHVTEGTSYQVTLSLLDPADWQQIQMVLKMPDGNGVDGTVLTNGPVTVQTKASFTGTMTVQLIGGWTQGASRDYTIALAAYDPCFIEGTARDTGTGEALPGIRIDLFRQDPGSMPDPIATTQSDANGAYRFRLDLPPNNSALWQAHYIVGFSDPAGLRQGEFSGGQLDWAAATHFGWAAGTTYSGVDGHLGLPWAVDAVVTDSATGQSLPGAIIREFQPNAVGWWVPVSTYIADSHGRVVFRETAHTVTRIEVRDPSDARPTQFLGGGFDVWDAKDFQLAAGTTMTAGFTVSLGAPIVGTVKDSVSGRPLSGDVVQAWRATQRDGWVLARSATVASDGTYGIAVVPGAYRICATDPTGGHDVAWNGGAFTLESAADVTAAGPGTVTVDFGPSPDHEAPSTIASAPTSWVKGPVLVSLIATDSGEGVAATYYRLPGDSAPRTYSTPLTIAVDGTTVISYWSVDKVNNTEAERTISVLVDSAGPGLLDDVRAAYDQEATITLGAGDALSGVRGIMYRVDASPWSWSKGTLSAISVKTPGAHVLEYYGVDNIGNESTRVLVPFKVLARSTQCTMTAGSGTIAFNGTLTVHGRLSAPGSPLLSREVTLEKSRDGMTFVAVGSSTTAAPDGAFAFTTAITENCFVRVAYAGETGIPGSVSNTVKVSAKALLPAIHAPSKARAGRGFKVTGTIAPNHASGSRVVRLQCYRREAGRWVLRKSVWASSRSGTTRSAYSVSLSLSHGSWRLIARHADAGHVATESPAHSIKVD
jgi:hypothetical protein